MLGALLAIMCAAALWGFLALAGELRQNSPLPRVLAVGFALRLVLQSFLRELPFFTHGGGGDCVQYEQTAQVIAQTWMRHGIHYVTADELPILGPTTLPSNLFALVIYFNGGDTTRLGCTALVALAAALTVLNVYTLAVQFGATRERALLFCSLIYFQPAFLFYTSDTYKDGLVLFFALGALGSALRVTYRFSIAHAALGVACIVALWYVRFYLIFVTVAPLIVGSVGLGSKRITRPLLATLMLLVAGIAIASFSDILQAASERASQTFETATSSFMMNGNRAGGSAVEFDDGGSPYAALPVKLLYTLFSPFLWANGSIGFHLGKLDVVLWYFIAYRAIRGARRVDPRLLMMLLTFIVPCTLMYAMTMANVGLVVRQRLIIVIPVALLAALYVPEARTARVRPLRRPRRIAESAPPKAA